MFIGKRWGNRLRPGILFWIYVAGYTFVRFFIERLRIDEASLIWGLLVNECVIAGMFLLSLGILVAMNFQETAPPDEQLGEADEVEDQRGGE